MTSLFRKLAWLMRRPGKEAELQEELQFHLEEEAEERAADGLSAGEARLAARRDLGNVTRVQEETRASWTWTAVEQFTQDVRYALRGMAANKTFSALAILSLALGIGANAAIFSFMDAILLRSLPVADPESLVTLSWHTHQPEVHGVDRHDDEFLDPGGGFTGGSFAYPAFEMFRKNDSIFSAVFGYQNAGDLHLAVQHQAEIANTEYVSGDYFQGLGVSPAAGRLIAPDDDRASAPPVAVISFALSERRFGGPANAIGQSILLNGLPFAIIGVAPPEFFGADPAALPGVYVPMRANLLFNDDRYHPAASSYTDPNYEWVVPMARLRPGVSRARAQAVLGPQFAEWMRAVNTIRNRSDLPVLLIRDGRGGLDGLRRAYSKPLFILLALAGLILALACANIANLLLARSSARRRELAVRLSIGAGRLRVLRQLLTESVTLASIGGAAAVGFAAWGIRLLTLLLANGQESFTLHADLNWRVLSAAAVLSIVTAILFGLAPALESTSVDLLPALKESPTGGARTRGFRRFWFSRPLMISQIAISLAILVAAGLFVRTLSNLESIPLGFNREGVLTFRINARQAGHTEPGIADFYANLRTRFASIPGVRSATFSDLPILGFGRYMTGVSVSGAEEKFSLILSVGPGFFTTMQIPLLAGREIEERDMTRSRPVAIVNQAFVTKNLGGRNPVGRILSVPYDCPKCAIEIVGVSANARVGKNPADPVQPTVFLPIAANRWAFAQDLVFELRAAGNPLRFVKSARDIVQQADPRLPLSEARTQSALIDGAINRQIVLARLCASFALLALIIACVGLYGAMSYHVARRTGEIGIRMALGAPRRRVLWMVLREVLAIAAAGLAVGIPIALAGSKLLKSFLFETKPDDPLTLIVAAVSLLTAAALAGYLPARAASRIDPLAALRHE